MKQFVKSVFVVLLVILLTLGSNHPLAQNAYASMTLENDDVTLMYVNKRFNINVDSGKKYKLTEFVELPAASLVLFQATYTPVSSNVRFGIMTPEGEAYLFSADNGKISGSIRVTTGGKYCLIIWNTSNVKVNIQGYCSY